MMLNAPYSDRCLREYFDLIIFSGPSGSGKDTVLRKAGDILYPTLTGLAVSCTTRAPRTNQKGYTEQYGIDYYFMNEEEFAQRVREGRFLEHNGVLGKHYGTPVEEIDRLRAMGCERIFLNIDPKGMQDITRRYPGIPTVFILPPSEQELRRRLIARETETPEQIEKRIIDARRQIACACDYDYVVMNDDLDRAAAEVAEIIRVSNHTAYHRLEMIDAVLGTFGK